MKILLVDDEKEFTDQLSERLKLRNYNVSAVYSGEAAVEEIGRVAFDVVILDVSMPGMDGIETLRQIKKVRPLTEVILLTGHATFETAVTGLKIGANDYLMKPANPGELIQKLEEAYERRKLQTEKLKVGKSSNLRS